MTAIPPVRRRIVGEALRQYRQGLGYALDDAARILECDRSKISRIETGHRGIRNRELRDLLAEYGVDTQAQDTLTMIANPHGVHAWWRSYAAVLPDVLLDLFALEAAASQIMVYEAQQVPDLIQDGEYAHALAEVTAALPSAGLPRALAETWAVRQNVIWDELRPEIAVVIGEAALQQMPGGPAVMRCQLDTLASADSRFPQVRIQVLPVTHRVHAAQGVGSFTILRYTALPDLGMVHLRGIVGGTFTEDQQEVAVYESAFQQLAASALTPETSTQLIRQMQAQDHPLADV